MPLPEGEGAVDPVDYREWVTTAPQPRTDPPASGDTPSAPQASQQPPAQPDGPSYAAYDPQQARTLPPGEPEAESLYDDAGEVLPSFDDRYRDDFVGLLYLGALTSTFHWLGHTFVIRTLSVDETLAVGALIKDYDGTLGMQRAYTTAMAAVCVVSIDGRGMPIPVGDSDDTYAWARQRFDYAKARWYAPTVDKIYQRYLELEARTSEVLGAMEKASDPAGSTAGSKSTSGEPTGEDS